MECVLCHVSHAQASCLPNGSFGRLLLPNKHLDGRRLSSSIGTNDCHTTHLGHSETHIHDSWFVLGGILESHTVHAQDHLAAALDAFHGTWFWESELHDFIGQLKVCFFLWVLLNELSQGGTFGAFEGLQLAFLEVDDVSAHLVKERREMGCADDAAWERFQPIFKPLDVVHIQMPRWLIQHENICIHELCSTQLHLHLPTTRVRSYWVLKVCCTIRTARVSKAN
mmetsp:Transcript_72604/g.128619  ORF Transcript_72604/g.128619 Transcript_72604/m.128619 type:complete len:225 (-) Transcript_72604:22-696(-)